MVHRRHDRPERRAVTLQFVDDNAKRNLALSLQELDKEAFRRTTVTPGLDEDVDHVAVLIHCTPEILPFAVDRNKDFVQEPRITETALSSLQFPCVLRTELRTPLSDCFVRNDDPAFREQIFHIAKAQAEPIVMPHGVTDDFGWESVSMIGGSRAFHGFSLPSAGQLDNSVQPVAEPVHVAPQSKLPWVGAMIAFVMITAVAVWNLKPEPPGAVVRFGHPLGEENFTREGRPLVGISRDGTQFAYVADDQIFLKNLNEAEARPVVGTDEDASTPVFSPDGQQLGFYSNQDGELKRIPVAGGTPVMVISTVFPYDITWGDDDTIMYSLNDGIWQISSNGGTPARIVELAGGESVFGSQLLPGGTHVLYSVWTGNDADQAEIVVEDLETHVRKTVWTGGNDARYLPTGHLVYAFENDLFALQFDLETLKVGEEGPVSVVPGVNNRAGPRGNPSAHYAISDTGTLVHRPGAGSTQNERVLAFVDRDGNTEVLPAPERRYDFTRLSPDERRIAAQIEDVGTTNIWIYDITSNVPSQLTFDGGERPMWTRDGTWITYRNEGSLWNIRADFSGTATELAGTNVAGNEGPGSWSVDDEVLLFSSPSGIHAWTRDNNGGSVKVIVEGGPGADRVFAPQFSPDGRWFVYGASDQNRQLFALPYPVGSAARRTITTDGGHGPIWPRRGNQLFYRTTGASRLIQAIPIQTDPTLERDNPVEGFVVDPISLSANGIPLYDVTPDGAHLLAAVRPGGVTATGDGDDYRRVNVILNWFEELKERVPVP